MHRKTVFATIVTIFISLNLSETNVSAQSFGTAVGAIPAHFSVNGNGGADYVLPIVVPPGTNGVAPRISLKYSSQGQMGIAGMGASISGISVIARCPRTLAQDGFQGGVNLSAGDRFCLNGNRLIAVRGKYGANGTVYHTERESWTIVTSHSDGSCGDGPCSFSLTTKIGIRQVFGTNDSSNHHRHSPRFRSGSRIQLRSTDQPQLLRGSGRACAQCRSVRGAHPTPEQGAQSPYPQHPRTQQAGLPGKRRAGNRTARYSTPPRSPARARPRPQN